MTSSRSHFYLSLKPDFRLWSNRLDLVPANRETAEVEWHDVERLGQLLDAHVPEQWPPALVQDSSSPNGEGWWDWYVVRRENDKRVLIGVAGLKGWPELSRTVQVGCSFLPEFQKQGYGTEAVDKLTSWALNEPHVDRVIAETPDGNDGAAAILRGLKFEEVDSSEEGLLRFEKSRKSMTDYRVRSDA